MLSVAKRSIYTAVAAGALVALTGGSVLAAHNTGAAQAATRHPVAAGRAAAGMGRGPGGFGQFGQRQGRMLKVTGVNGNTITATNRRGQQVTVTVSSSTTYTRAGATASLSDVKTGVTIAVRGQAGASAQIIQAQQIVIVLTTDTGVVTAVNGNSLTITDLNAMQRTITLDGSTSYKRAGQNAAQSDISVGTLITAQGNQNSDGSLSAVLVSIHLPRLAGTVSGLQNSQFTLTTAGGSTYTVQTNTQTTYTQPGYGAATAAALKNGGPAAVEGIISSDGKTLTAIQITVLPNSRGPKNAAGSTTGSTA